MFYFEDTTTVEATENKDDQLLILDGTVRLDYFGDKPDLAEKKTAMGTIIQYFKKLI